MTDAEADLIRKLILEQIAAPMLERIRLLEAEVAELRWKSNLPIRDEVLAEIRRQESHQDKPTVKVDQLYQSTSLG